MLAYTAVACLALVSFVTYLYNEGTYVQQVLASITVGSNAKGWSNYDDITTFKVGQKGQYSQKSRDKFNLFQHTGGLGPYIEHKGYGISVEPPESCTVKQVHLLGRHTERYPTPEKTFHATVNKLKGTTNGSLEFLNDYKFFITEPAKQYGRLTWTGPYNGIDEARRMGEKYRQRYNSLLTEFNSAPSDGLPIFAGSSSRVIATAEQFGNGLLGYDWEVNNRGKLVIITEKASAGGDSLTPDKCCKPYDKEHEHRNYHRFFHKFFARTLNRLQKETSAELTFEDVQNMVEMCYFELNTKEDSQFCDVFTADEHVAYGYTRALRYFYRNGPGNPLSANIGSVYANATLQLLNQETTELPFYFSFSHDTHLNYFYAFVGMFSDNKPLLPYDHMDVHHPWVDSILTPMGAHIAIEKLSCTEDNQSNDYVRFIINDAVIPYHACQSGPGYSCPLSDFTKDMNKRLSDKPYSICDLDSSLPKYISFFWNWRSHVNQQEVPEIL